MKWALWTARLILGGPQLIACAVCLYAASKGVWIGIIGAADTLIFGVAMFLWPYSGPDPSK